ncbi:BamA/TamA family outer membrane protein [Pyxidicoccus parkwayensis]|uniref:BamA/TamA family outer membrane protein n=1 Tax=Pyxidicoccus parkwayensis TaxID=2813578 RepID=A0ABX7NVJ3_9BACT|nr:BamA/TamA family outer membrane protein [Pyxidicoccus parkwaysis]QSQ22946.1 BamA/TamA family outer membrane protein [Pyxidicoccus parkwaysis]
MAADQLRTLRLATIAALLLLATACATTQERPPGPKLNHLNIEGTHQVSEGDIKDRILTSATPWWGFWPFGGPHYFDPNAWQADLRRIQRFYQAQGFYDAEVLSSEVKPQGANAVSIEVKVKEGEPTRIGDIEVTGLDALPQEFRKAHSERVMADLPMKKGDIFREDTWEETKAQVQGRLRELGYAEAEAGGEVRVDLETKQATVDLRITPGPRYRFGNTFVATDANPQVPPRRIIEQVQGSLKKGDWYSETALAEAQARVFRMGVFGAVKVNRGAPDRESGTVPVVVDVRESPFRSVRLGGGLGVDAARQEVRVLGEWTHRNFRGGLRRFTVRGRLGYAFIPSVFNRSKAGPVGEITTEFEQPRFLFRDLRLQTSLTLERGLEQAYDFWGGKLQAGVIWQPHRSLSIFPSYNLEVYRLTGRVSADERVPPIVLGCANNVTQCNIALSYLEVAVAWDRRDDPIEPRDGYYLAMSVQKGGSPFFFGDFTYVRLLPDLRFYQALDEDKRAVLAVKVRLGTLNPAGGGQSSIVTRFFSGGATAMRGFNGQRLSPLVALPTTANEPGPDGTVVPVVTQNQQWDTVPVGGNSMFESAVELRYQFSQSLMAAAFWDSGLVGIYDFSSKLSPRLFGPDHYHAVGLGMRYLTVVGPIRLDIARRLNIGRGLPVTTPGYIYPESGGCFGIGSKWKTNGPIARGATYAGSPEGLCALHLSIGEAF